MSNFIIGQTGTPRDSSVAKMLYNEGLLDQLIVDTFYSKDKWYAKIPVISKKIEKNFSKYDPGFPNEYVSGDPFGALIFRYLLNKSRRKQAFTYARKRLGSRLIKYASKRAAGKFYGFDTISLDFLKWSAKNGWEGYLEQCVASRTSQINMWKLFSEKYGLNTKPMIDYCLFQQEVERQEWQLSNHIIVPSLFVKKSIVDDKIVDQSKITLVNYGFTPQVEGETIRENITKKFSVKQKTINLLFVGNAGYRKGIADILEIADDLKNENLSFFIAGSLEAEANKLLDKYVHPNITCLGKLSKNVLSEYYMKSDIFFFPSYLEGSAMVLMEAMSWGLPIITTRESGSNVEDKKNGFICDAGDIKELKSNIIKLANDNELRYAMSMQSLNVSQNYSAFSYSENLLKLLENKI